ncbi:MAG TPA: VTT domain-containing protein [Vicinamibacterales bacterium]|nr:VTT domain-containing protein [Vicinamibacterales bacterium]
MRAFFFSIVGYFLTPVGVVLMGALDASLVFYLPFGIDFVVVLVAARHPEWFWLYALLAAVGSVAGAAGTFWIGQKIGERGLAPFVSHGRLRRVKRSINRGVFVLAGFGVIPPPFPFTAFVLAGGALDVSPWSFFSALAAARALRFGVEGALAAHYGRQILRWTKTPLFEWIVGMLIALAIVGTIVSAVAVARKSRAR